MGLKSLYKSAKKKGKKGIKKVTGAAKNISKKLDASVDAINDSTLGDLIDTAVMSTTGIADITGKAADVTEGIKNQMAFADAVAAGILDMNFKKIKNAAIDMALKDLQSRIQIKQ